MFFFFEYLFKHIEIMLIFELNSNILNNIEFLYIIQQSQVAVRFAVKANLVLSLALAFLLSRFLYQFHPLILDLPPGKHYYFGFANELFQTGHFDVTTPRLTLQLVATC